MTNEHTEQVDAQEEPQVEAQEAIGESQEPQEDLQKKLKELEAQKEHWRSKAKKLEEQAPKEVEPQNYKSTDETQDFDLHQTVKQLSEAEKKRQFGYRHGLSPEETDAVFKINPNPSKEDLDDPFVKGGLDAIRAKRRVQSATPSSSGGSNRVEVTKLKDMKPEEANLAYKKMMEARLGKRTS